MVHVIKKGLDLPLSGAPNNVVDASKKVKKVALIGSDYNGMKPTMKVQIGDTVKIGQPLFECKKVPGVVYTSPAGGIVKNVNRGERRVFQSIEIEVSEKEEHHAFSSYKDDSLSSYSKDEIQNLLVESGLWASLRTRPFSKAPHLGSAPKDIFVTAIDTNPLAMNPEVFVLEREREFNLGLELLSLLTEGKVYTCLKKGTRIKVETESEKVSTEYFSGPHPSGLAGTHIHLLSPASMERVVWSVDYQDVIAMGSLLMTGKLLVEKIISIAGPLVKKPRFFRTRVGASLNELVEGELLEGDSRIISGPVLSGRTSEGSFSYLGRFHNQVTVLLEGRQREFLGWHSPGFDKFSVMKIYVSQLFKNKKFPFNTNTNGSQRAIVPVGVFEKVMPLDILPTQLLRSLSVHDTDSCVELGALELSEEDLALCTYACPGKNDYGTALRETLNIIEKEG